MVSEGPERAFAALTNQGGQVVVLPIRNLGDRDLALPTCSAERHLFPDAEGAELKAIDREGVHQPPGS